MSLNRVVLLLGSNLGDKEKNINTALDTLQSEGCYVKKKTFFLNNMPVEFHSSNNFCNIATLIETKNSPIQLLKIIKNIETKMGREADSKVLGKYTDRIIDIDIVMFNNISYQSEKLTIPHYKNMYEREFSKKLIKELENNENK